MRIVSNRRNWSSMVRTKIKMTLMPLTIAVSAGTQQTTTTTL
jgi:hypothetical protein